MANIQQRGLLYRSSAIITTGATGGARYVFTDSTNSLLAQAPTTGAVSALFPIFAADFGSDRPSITARAWVVVGGTSSTTTFTFDIVPVTLAAGAFVAGTPLLTGTIASPQANLVTPMVTATPVKLPPDALYAYTVSPSGTPNVSVGISGAVYLDWA